VGTTNKIQLDLVASHTLGIFFYSTIFKQAILESALPLDPDVQESCLNIDLLPCSITSFT